MMEVTEAELLDAIRDLARYRKWLTYHTYRATRSEAGFPDLVLARSGRLVFAELKSASGRLSTAQRTWMLALRSLDGVVEYHLWTPKQWHDGTIDEILV
jgi:hypothetical protein